jgi:cobaltochelatase CobT
MRTTLLRTDQIRDAVAKTTRMLAKQAIRVTQIGAQAYCKFEVKTGKVVAINLPVIPDAPSEEFLIALQGFLDHEVAHALFTNGKMHCVTEGSDGEKEVNLRGLTNIVEDVRIEKEMAIAYPGAEANMEGLRDFMIEKYWNKWLGQVNAASLPDAEKERRRRTLSMVPYMRARGGQKKLQRWMDDNGLFPLFEVLDQRIPDIAERLKGLASTEEAFKLAQDIHDAIKPPKPPEKEEGDDQSLGEAEGGTAKGDQGDDQENPDGEGAGGSEDESESDTHQADQDAPADEKPGKDQPDLDDIDFGAEGDMSEDDGQGGQHTDQSGDEPGDGDGESDKASDELTDGEGEDTNVTMREAMKTLNAEQRRALFLYNKKRQTVEEIAGRLGKTRSQTVTILAAARRKLNQALLGKA